MNAAGTSAARTLIAPLRPRLRQHFGFDVRQPRFHQEHLACLVSRGHDERGAVHRRGHDVAHRVRDPRGRMHIDKGGRPGCLCVAVGDRDSRSSCRARMYLKSLGSSFKKVSSVEPGLPNTVVSPSLRSRSNVTSRIVCISTHSPCCSSVWSCTTSSSRSGHAGLLQVAREQHRRITHPFLHVALVEPSPSTIE